MEQIVYVDELRSTPKTRKWPYNKACHLFCEPSADLSELHRIALAIGMRPDWFQNHSVIPHYDLTEGMRFQAMRHGAVEADMKLTAAIIKKWRAFKAERQEAYSG